MIWPRKNHTETTAEGTNREEEQKAQNRERHTMTGIHEGVKWFVYSPLCTSTPSAVLAISISFQSISFIITTTTCILLFRRSFFLSQAEAEADLVVESRAAAAAATRRIIVKPSSSTY